MDPLRLCLALGPLAIYLVVVAAINLGRRPFLVSGARDTAALGVGVSGLILVGPIELLLPHSAVNNFMGHMWVVWALLLTLYTLSLSLVVMLQRPRLVVYNISADEFRPVLAEVVIGLDPDARWAGTSFVLPRLRVHAHLESMSALRNVSLVSSGDDQSYAGWRQLELELARRLAPAESAPNAWGLTLALASLAMFAVMIAQMAMNGPEITQAFRDMLRL